VDCVGAGTEDMKKQGVLETLHSKKEQISLATQAYKNFEKRTWKSQKNKKNNFQKIKTKIYGDLK
jgi:hypothetical protein